MIFGANPYGAVEYGGIVPAQFGAGIVLRKTSSGVITDITLYALWRSVELLKVLTKEVGTLHFDIYGTPGAPVPAMGDTIDLYENSVHIFGGTVTHIKISTQGGILLRYSITCTDWSFQMNGKLVVNTYTNQDPGDIVKDIIANFTAGGFTTYNVQNVGMNISSIQFNYEQVTMAIEKLAKQVGFEWFVDADKDVHFFAPSVVANAPYEIDDSSGNLEWATLDIDQSVVNMKNSIVVIGGTYTKSFDATSTPDKYLTDGTKVVFPLGYSYKASTIVVTLDGVAQSVGTDQVTDPLTVQVLYNEASRFVRFISTPSTGKTVKIYGTAQIPILANVKDQEAISVYSEIQGSIIDQHIASIAEAQERGQAQIAEYGSPVYAVKFSTLKTGFEVGQTLRVTSTIFGLDILVEIKRIIGRIYAPGDPNDSSNASKFRYEIECVGTEQVNFVDIMKLLLTEANANTIIGGSTVLQVLSLFNESIASADTLLAPTTSSPPYLWGSFNWGFGTWHS